MMSTVHRNLVGTLLATALLCGCAASKLHRDGLAEIDRGNYEAGVADLAQAVQHDPDNMMYKLDLAARREASIQKLVAEAEALRGSGRLDQAAATYRRVLAIEPANQRAERGIEGIESDRRHSAMVAEAAKKFQQKDYDGADSILHTVSMRIRATVRRPT